ncbi:MAG: type IV secretion system DNA-binding domain-containing protein [Azoarcus sp.]|jgi:type IV conjugative transfer system coupling protein TraD|nr:type IV secretion system DNA-binding domain-containing protein [Azoarcus sp.]
MTAREKGGVVSFSRGAEIWMHYARMFAVSCGIVIASSLALGMLIGGVFFYIRTDASDRYWIERNYAAKLREAVFMGRSKMALEVDGARHTLTAEEVKQLTEEPSEFARVTAWNGMVLGGEVALGAIFLIVLYWWHYGRGKMRDSHVRGASLVDGSELKRQIDANGDGSPYEIAGVPMRRKSETLHSLFAGAQGTGKSQQFFALMRQVRRRGKKTIVYDPTGEFTQEFYRPGIDILMNPLDARSPNWNPWCEIDMDYHYDNLAAGLIPEPSDTDPFWALAGRAVFSDTLRVLGRANRGTNSALCSVLLNSSLDSLHATLMGTAAASYVDPKTERTGMSLKMTVQNQLNAFRLLHDEGELFSIRKWIREEGTDSWMFITARESVREALKPILSLWLDTTIKAVLDLEPIHTERMWFFIDELPTLQRIDSLKLALTNTRKFGLCMVLGVQDFSQIYSLYGQDLAKTIISGCQTKLLLRVTDGTAAKLLVELVGQAEVDQKEETLSYGTTSQRDGVSIIARRSMRDILLPSEITTLPDMEGYLLVPGPYPVGRAKYGFAAPQKNVPGFVARPGFDASAFNISPQLSALRHLLH